MNIASGVDKSDARVRQMFGEIAPQYDRMNHLLSMNVDRYWRFRAVRKLAPQPGDHVLDVCTGTGDLAFAFEKYGNGRLKIEATDFCPEMLEVANQKKKDSSHINFSEADAQNLPFEDSQFEIVTVAFGLRNVADTDRGLAELARVCKPGGKVGILEFSTPRRWPIRPAYQWYFKNILPRIGQRFASNKSQAYDYLPSSVGEFPAYEELAARIKSAGMTRVKFFPLTFGIATLYIGVK